MASAVPKIGPTLRASGGGTAGALTDGQVGARRLKKVVETDVIKVSNNFRMLQRRYPSRKGTGPSMPGGSPTGSTADVIPSDEEVSDVDMSSVARLANEERDFALATAQPGHGDNETGDEDEAVEDDEHVRARHQPLKPPVSGRRHSSVDARTSMSPGRKYKNRAGTVVPIARSGTNTPTLRFGMDALRENMTLPGTAAYRFASTMGVFDAHDVWADDFGKVVEALRDEDNALDLALSQEYAAQTYLGIDRNTSCFLVLHGLRRWTPNPSSRSMNSGRLVAWEGETLQDGGPPDLWRLESDEAQLFQLVPFSGVDLKKVSQFYSDEKNDNEFFDVGDLSHHDGHWVSRLVPIPTGWAALFLDYPPLGVAFRRVRDLINSIATDKADNFQILAWQMACACFRTNGIEPCSALALEWSRLARSKSNLELSLRAWQDAEDDSYDVSALGNRKNPPEQGDDFRALFGGGKRPKLNLGRWAPPCGSKIAGSGPNTGWAPGPPPIHRPSPAHMQLTSLPCSPQWFKPRRTGRLRWRRQTQRT